MKRPTASTARATVVVVFVIFVSMLLSPRAARAQQRFALVVSGASGGEQYAAQYAAWTAALARVFTERLKMDRGAVTILSDSAQPSESATADNVRRAISAVRTVMTRDDLFLIVLIGHGTFDGVDAKFNLVGRDLESADWAALLKTVPGRLVVVNTTAGSFPFIERLSAPRRIVISATDSVAQRFDTVFAQYFIRAFDDDSADLDKNQRISLWEAFASAGAGVRRHYQQRGQLATERALIDDNGDGIGRGVGEDGDDGSSASRTYLDESLPGAAPTDEALVKLLQRKSLLETEMEELKIRRSFLSADQYAQEFERIMIDLARVSSEIRKRRLTPLYSPSASRSPRSRARPVARLFWMKASRPITSTATVPNVARVRPGHASSNVTPDNSVSRSIRTGGRPI
ncbi:MAG: hypothetical protein ABIP65_01780 [Vicinamibacterales bacterium]